MERRMVVAQADCPARRVPDGTPLTIPKDTFVTITQSLGGNYTVTYKGQMVRIDGTDAANIGLEPELLSFPAPTDELIHEAQVWEALRTVFDPEIPVDIVNLGLVYDCCIEESDGKKIVAVKMTLTAPGCGMGPVIAADAQAKIMTIDGIDDARVELVWDPAWNQEMISEEGKMKLGMI